MNRLHKIIAFILFTVIAVQLSSCKKEHDRRKIGSEYGGGIIFYLDQTGQHGWIAAMEDLPMAHWGISISYGPGVSYYPPTNAASTIDGFGNTKKIVSVYGDTVIYAARSCYEYGGGGFHDWYLPAKEQLDSLYHRSISDLGFLNMRHDYMYWSSTESSGFDAWFQDFGNGLQFDRLPGPWWPDKEVNAFIRPVRSF